MAFRHAQTMPLYSLGTTRSPRPNPDRMSASGEIECLPPQPGGADMLLRDPRELSTARHRLRTVGPSDLNAELTWIHERPMPLPHWVWPIAAAAFLLGFATMMLLA